MVDWVKISTKFAADDDSITSVRNLPPTRNHNFFNKKTAPFIAPQTGYVSVDLLRSDRQIASFENYFSGGEKLSPASPVKIAIGVNLDGDLVEAYLGDLNTCHFLIGGATGSGKSVGNAIASPQSYLSTFSR